MGFPSNWLIATNGSKYASEAVKHAGMLSSLLNNKPTVTILVVADDKESEDTAKGIVEMAKFLFETNSGPEMDPELAVEIGEPGKTIIKTAEKLECDQIFIGGADFKWDINDGKPGGISNYIIDKFNGVITVVK
jgi:nucleotide-binding universal stress UspA family protein